MKKINQQFALIKRLKLQVNLMMKKILFFALFLSVFTFTHFAQNSDEVIKIETALVNIPVIVSDRNGRNISGLQIENFTVFEDSKPQKIEYFASEKSPLNVAILLDTSRSTQQVLGKIKKAAREFIKQLQPNDQGLIVSFDNDVEFLSELTSDRKTLDRAIKNAEIGEQVGTVLQDAVFDVVNNKFAKVKGRKAIILLTDGKDFGSYINRKDLIYRLEESDTLVYSIFYETGNIRRLNNNRLPSIIFPNPNRRGGMRGQRRRQTPFPDNFPPPNQNPRNQGRVIQQQMNEDAISFLKQISDSTAGRLYQNEIDDLEKTFAIIANELRNQYLIGYYPEKSETTKNIHQVKVKVDKNDVVVRSKNTYRSQ
ncbi:MAG: VWA domain-containing protein [Acidobacteriota bacterium]